MFLFCYNSVFQDYFAGQFNYFVHRDFAVHIFVSIFLPRTMSRDLGPRVRGQYGRKITKLSLVPSFLFKMKIIQLKYTPVPFLGGFSITEKSCILLSYHIATKTSGQV
jgi:hypothetical protein